MATGAMNGRRAGWLAVGTITALMLAGEGGCSLRRPIDLGLAQPAEGWSPRTAVDIHNFHGTVRVVVDPRLEEADVSAVAGAKPPIESAADSRATESVSVVADWVEQEGGRVLRVRTGSTWYSPDEVWVDITVKVPSCAGATIWNRGGYVELIGVEGALQVDNGALGSSDGTIRVRTARAMTQPVSLVTDKGTVVYQIAANSTGVFDLSAPNGRAVFNSLSATPGAIQSESHRTLTVLNGGTNPVTLRSENGMVKAQVLADPEAYTNKWE